jgi:hypothetical protein
MRKGLPITERKRAWQRWPEGLRNALLGAALLFAIATSAGAAPAAGAGKPCTVSNAGGSPSSTAIGGWSYDVDFSCPARLTSFSLATNKRVRSGKDKSGLQTPIASATLGSGQEVNFACAPTSAESYRCTLKSSLPAGIAVVEGFDSSTPCSGKAFLTARLTVDGQATRVSFNGETTSGSLTGGCG